MRKRMALSHPLDLVLIPVRYGGYAAGGASDRYAKK